MTERTLYVWFPPIPEVAEVKEFGEKIGYCFSYAADLMPFHHRSVGLKDTVTFAIPGFGA